MARMREGYVRVREIEDNNGKKKIIYAARVTYVDHSGKRKEIERRATSRSNAKELIKQINQELDERGHKAFDGARMTFADLAGFFTEQYLIAPQYVSGRKVAGRRTYKDALILKGILVAHFGAARLKEITHGDLERYRRKRLKTPTKAGRQRSIASVNRELSLMRRMLNVAIQKGWLHINPFSTGDTLIATVDEVKRERILSRDEETRLLSVCTGKRAHLKRLVICALDTGMRRGEILKLKWADVNFVQRTILIQAFNTKTMKERTVNMTARLARELAELFDANKPKPTDSVFGIASTVKRSFNTACRLAGITNLRFHDLRHTAATRLIQGQMPLAEVGRILGHSDPSTTYRYVNMTPETAERAASIFDRMQSEVEHRESKPS